MVPPPNRQLPLAAIYRWRLFTAGGCLPLGDVYRWGMFTAGGCLPLGDVYRWGLFTAGGQDFIYQPARAPMSNT